MEQQPVEPSSEHDAPWPTVHRMSAFTTRPDGGNPAGVVITDTPLDDAVMQRIATDVGYSETAFLSSPSMDGHEPGRAYRVRYFSPQAEVPFCGHATIASGIVLGTTSAEATYRLLTNGGEVGLEVRRDGEALTATLTSVTPQVEPADAGLVRTTLRTLPWMPSDLDPAFEPVVAYAGARHLVLVAATRERLADLDYDFDALRMLMAEHDLTTVALVWRENATHFHARNPFPPGGVVEDPATGAAAAAFGAYLRAHRHVNPPTTIQISQGSDMGRPSQLTVHIPTGHAGIAVTGSAVAIS